MILVTAATGQVGNRAARELLAAGVPVRALVRDPVAAAALEGAEVVPGSFDDDASLETALRGVDVLLLAGRDGPQSVAQHERVLGHAARAGVQHIVKLSAIGAAPDSPVALMREHHEVDERVRTGAASFTLLQPHLYLQNLLRAAEAARRDGVLAAPLGATAFPLVDTRDVGRAAAVVLRAPAAHAGRTYTLTGPAAVTYDEVAAALAVVAGRPVVYEPVTPSVFAARLRMAGMPDWRAFDLGHIASAYAPADNVVSPDLPRLLGRAPCSLSAFLDEHRAVFA